MSALHAFTQGFLFSLSLCFDLGLVNVALMRRGMERGFGAAFMLGFGSCFGDLFYLSLALLGVSAVFELAPVKWTLWLAGSGFLLYLAWKMLRSLRSAPEAARADAAAAAETASAKEPAGASAAGQAAPGQAAYRPQRYGRDFAAGIGLALSSPSAVAWFALVAGPMLGQMQVGRAELTSFMSGFFVAGLLWSLAMAAFSSLSGAMLGASAVRILALLSALLFVYFAVRIFLHGLAELAGYRLWPL
ncbi:LysE family transporter [Paenibacillus athensensis]|uniref:Lysine transporter LysE n=1 Tax=Paenibacillus athensensis TaxID=1967502 RepID=A0A4Y8Q623_9BACL|nr:LysE family transporter [Paenibacillus athensensis]MCD1259812.1 LysE family transporter [Paenibacillus athensensis]